jgi:hypothetical protein
MVEEEAMKVGKTKSEVKRIGIDKMPYAPKEATGINYY